jgi:hypothetical protein
MTRKILLVVVTLGLFSIEGCYLSSIGVYARYEDYGHEEAKEYPAHCYDCHSSPHYGRFHGCDEFIFTISAHSYTYTPRVTKVVVVEKVEKEVEMVKYKETTRTKGKTVRKSSQKTY